MCKIIRHLFSIFYGLLKRRYRMVFIFTILLVTIIIRIMCPTSECYWLKTHFYHIRNKITELMCPFRSQTHHKQDEKLILIINRPGDFELKGTARCDYKNCLFTYNLCDFARSDAVLYNVNYLYQKEPHKRRLGQVFIFWTLESPVSYVHRGGQQRFHGKKWRNYFNWTLTYRRDSDIFHPYVRFFLLQDPKIYNTKFSNLSKIVHSKSKNIAWFVSHCNTESKREMYVNTLKKYIDVDVYGYCGPLKCASMSDRWSCLQLLNDYHFYLAFENSLCRDYVTEKQLYTAYKNGFIIPVTRGDSYSQLYKPSNSYIDTSKFSSVKEMADFLKKVAANKTMYMSYFYSRKYFDVDEDYNLGLCELCN